MTILRLLLRSVVLCLTCLVLIHNSKLPFAADDVKWQSTGPTIELKITDGERCNALPTGAWQLSGTLKIVFDGRVLPHEGSVIELCGADVKQVKGRFDKVELPTGWLSDIVYGDKSPFVVMKNFRPDHSPAFPGAEGFGKYTIGGRGGASHRSHQPGRFGRRQFSSGLHGQGAKDRGVSYIRHDCPEDRHDDQESVPHDRGSNRSG